MDQLLAGFGAQAGDDFIIKIWGNGLALESLHALDVLLLKGVDMGVMEKDDLLVATKKEPVVFSTGAQRLQYISKIANNDYQLLARKEIKSIYDLKGKKVNFLKKMSSTNLACETIFKALNIDVQPVFFDQETASAKLGRPAGVVQDAVLAEVRRFVGGAPQFDDITVMVVVRDVKASEAS